MRVRLFNSEAPNWLCALIKQALAKTNGRLTDAASQVTLSYQALAYIIEGRHKDLLKARSPLFAFVKFGRIDATELKQEFPDWRSLASTDTASSLCTKLIEWSKKWNLDADWCRDHAVESLRLCILDEYLRWSFLSEVTPLRLALQPFLNSSALDVSQTLNTSLYDNRVIHKSWRWAIHELTTDIYWSRLYLSAEVHGGKFDPENFEFKWRKIKFSRHGYNRLRYTQRQYKKLATLEFRLYLN